MTNIATNGVEHSIAPSAWQSLSLVRCLFMVFRFFDFAFLTFWASCESVWFIRQEGSAAPVSQLARQLKSFRRFTTAAVTSLNMITRSAVVSRVPAKKQRVSRLYGVFVSAYGACFNGRACAVVCRTETANTETISQIHEPSSLKLGYHDMVLTACRDVYEEACGPFLVTYG